MRRCLAWFDKYLKSDGSSQATYRIGDRVEHEGYELIASRAEDVQYLNWDEQSGRLVEVAVSIASQDPVESAFDLALSDVQLLDPELRPVPMRGIPIEAGGRTLVEGDNLAILAEPDRDTGRIRFGIAAAYEIPHDGGVFQLKVAEFPPVQIAVGFKEKDEEESESTPSTPSAPLSMPGQEGPIITPER
jgi:hypothetical protein